MLPRVILKLFRQIIKVKRSSLKFSKRSIFKSMIYLKIATKYSRLLTCTYQRKPDSLFGRIARWIKVFKIYVREILIINIYSERGSSIIQYDITKNIISSINYKKPRNNTNELFLSLNINLSCWHRIMLERC
jgi:hypothetical protein